MTAANDPKPVPAGSGKPGHPFPDEEEEWRHAPVAPKDAGVLDSIGRSISEAVVGAEAPATEPAPKPKSSRPA